MVKTRGKESYEKKATFLPVGLKGFIEVRRHSSIDIEVYGSLYQGKKQGRTFKGLEGVREENIRAIEGTLSGQTQNALKGRCRLMRSLECHTQEFGLNTANTELP